MLWHPAAVYRPVVPHSDDIHHCLSPLPPMLPQKKKQVCDTQQQESSLWPITSLHSQSSRVIKERGSDRAEL